MPSLFSAYEDPTISEDIKEMAKQGGVFGRRVLMDTEKLVEGFTTAFPNESLDEIKKRDDQYVAVTDNVNRSLSNLARAQMVTNTETNNYLQGATRNTKYLNQIVQLGDGTIGYVTNQGVFKRFNSRADVDATMGKNGCPAGITGIKTAAGSTYSNNGQYVNADVPLFVGTPMVRAQQCGYAGQNIFVDKTVAGSGDGSLLGCKKGNNSLVPTGLKMNVDTPSCPAGTFQCQGGPRGYCYDPRRDQMVSTYMLPQYDAPIGSSSGNAPFLAEDGVTYLWFRSGGYDSACGSKPTMPPCPAGTAPCASGNNPGYCWDPSRKIMVTTVNPNSGDDDSGMKPNFMYLVKGNEFNYDELSDPNVTVSRMRDTPWARMQGWIPDQQFTDQYYAAENKVYLQFKAAAAKMMPHLEIGGTGELTVLTTGNVISWTTQGRYNNAVAGSVFVNGVGVFRRGIQLNNVRDKAGSLIPSLIINWSVDTMYVQTPRPDSNTEYMYYFTESPSSIIGQSGGRGYSSEGAIFSVTKTSNNAANATLTYGGNVKNVSYTFTTSLPKAVSGLRSQDGNTMLWKKMDGYDSGCGSEPSVPPVVQGGEFLSKCKDIANAGGFGVYGIMNGECYIGESADTLQPGSGCKSIGGSDMIGDAENIAAYKLVGNRNTGMFQYGYVTADETLKAYPGNLQRVTGRFTGIGRKQIARTPRNKTFNGVPDEGKCKTQCISTFGNDCEAYNYNAQSGSCVAYGADSLKKGVIIPVGDSELMIRQKELNNDITCPKKFATVSSSVWENLPKDSVMSEQTQCNLGHRTQQSIANQQSAVAQLNNSVNAMQRIVEQDVSSATQLQPSWAGGMKTLRDTLSEYKKIYEGSAGRP